MCAHAQSWARNPFHPLRPGSRARLRALEALDLFCFILYRAMLSEPYFFKHSDTKWEQHTYIHSRSNFRGAPDPGGGGGGQGGQSPPMKILNIKKFIISNARIGWKSTVIHYKAIQFNIKIILNIRNSKFWNCSSFCPPPLPPIRKIDRRPCSKSATVPVVRSKYENTPNNLQQKRFHLYVT